MAASKSTTLFLIILIACIVPQISSSRSRPQDWELIKNIGDPKIVSLAEFAIDEHAKVAHESLTLKKLHKAYYKVVTGTLYRLFFTATRDRHTRRYIALVLVKLDGSQKLLHFSEIALIKRVSNIN
uniref:Cystatin domain-containing protein n=1 Tax=Kalanchoe fedtschenkoi TaxID=63787 RepID=A0A7N0TK33_KALFE